MRFFSLVFLHFEYTSLQCGGCNVVQIHRKSEPTVPRCRRRPIVADFVDHDAPLENCRRSVDDPGGSYPPSEARTKVVGDNTWFGAPGRNKTRDASPRMTLDNDLASPIPFAMFSDVPRNILLHILIVYIHLVRDTTVSLDLNNLFKIRLLFLNSYKRWI